MDTGEIRKSVSLFGCRSESEIEWYPRRGKKIFTKNNMLLTAAAATVAVADCDSK